jgi:glucose-1-phosphate thymidylyltransferase
VKGIILAGGKGTRLYPSTEAVSKGLLPIYDKPMIYYPLTTLIENGIKEINIISDSINLNKYNKLLGCGSRFGVKFNYLVQYEPRGIAEAFIIAESKIKKEKTALILGDNIFSSSNVFKRAFREFKSGAVNFGYEVSNPSRYGVIEFDDEKVLSIEEKPKKPKSNYAVPGLYLYDGSVFDVARNLQPSERGELEITDVNKHYLSAGQLKVYKINRGCVWLDAGTPSSLHESAEYIEVIEKRQGIKVGCVEEASLNSKFIDKDQLNVILNEMPDCDYKDYLKKL